jgi:hypothetical protein
MFKDIPMKIMMKFRDGRFVYQIEEESAIKIMITIKGLIALRKKEHIMKLLEIIEKMDGGEVYWWYSLYLKMGSKAMRALRAAYL